MTKKVIVFDLDSTLAASKTAITDQMARLLGQLLERYQVCVISGGKYEQFQKQLLANLDLTPQQAANLHLMPTCGTRYYRFLKVAWQQVYAEDLTAKERQTIIAVLSQGAKELGLWEEQPWGEIVEDRGSQITFSALGQEAPLEAKLAWDPDRKKKEALRDYAAALLPDHEVRIGGKTSVDVTRQGIDKAYGVRKLQQTLGVELADMLFIGDELGEGGNDYPVKALGVEAIEVEGPEEAERVIAELLRPSS